MKSDQRSRVIVVKVGSQVLCTESGQLDDDVIADLARQLAMLAGEGWKVLVVSSGAVAAGTGHLGEQAVRLGDPVMRKQVLAATGQVVLMDSWRREMARHDIKVAQVLASKSDFKTRHHYLNMRNCLEGLVRASIVPVVNENDVVAVTELMFTDNDELAGLLAGMVGADLLVLLSAVSGLYRTEDGVESVIPEWDESIHRPEEIVRRGTSRMGRGGMHSKLNMAIETASLGTEVVIAGGREPDILLRIARQDAVGTRFRAREALSPAKRWLASAEGHASARVTVNQGAADALADRGRLTSLLPVGIVRLDGAFERGDVLLIEDEEGRVLGCGRAQYDREAAEQVLGKRDERPLVHYDYLYLAGRGDQPWMRKV